MRLLIAALAIAASTSPAHPQETRASAAAKFSREFAASDADKDGVLSREEVQARMSRMGAGKKRFDAVHAKRLTDLWFDRADANRNGKVTQAEAQALLAATFQRYDANGDGQIGNDERAAASAGAKRGQ